MTMLVYESCAARLAGGCAPREGWRRGRLICLAALAAFLCGHAPARAAGVRGLDYSLTPSASEPYAACPAPPPGHVACLSVVDPAPPSAIGSPSGFGELVRRPGQRAFTPNLEPSLYCSNQYFCGSGVNGGLSPEDLQSAYKLKSTSAGSGEKIAIVVAYDDPHAQSDMNVYRETYGLPPCEGDCFSKVNQMGGTELPGNAPHKEDWPAETSLDLDMASAACPNCHLLLVEAKSSVVENMGIAENEAAALGATVISNSYGMVEGELSKSKEEAQSKYYNHPGIPITVAGGDYAYDNEENCIALSGGGEECAASPNFPAALPSVIAVGGTSLGQEAGSRGWSESVWRDSGSGCSLYPAKPSWQKDTGCAKRTDNDAAAVADTFESPVSMYNTDTKGYPLKPGWQLFGGTSVATPLVAGAMALESSALRVKGADGIYENPGNWFDVTSGNNWPSKLDPCKSAYLCHAEVGYDGPTGIGTPDGGAASTLPSAVTGSATSVTQTGATLNAKLDPENASTVYYFQYGTTAAYGTNVPSSPAEAGFSTNFEYESQAIAGLKAESIYHFRVLATNSAGTTYGADRTFSTPPQVYLRQVGSKGSGKGQFEGPDGVALDGYGDVWVADKANNRIEEFSPSGTFMAAYGSKGTGNGQFIEPAGIAIEPSNLEEIYVIDKGNDRIEVFSNDGKFIRAFGSAGSGAGQLSAPSSITFAESVIWIADSGNNRIEEFGETGKYLSSYGAYGAGEGQFNDPTGVVLVEGGLFTLHLDVVDSGNSRVQMLSFSSFFGENPSYKYLGQFGSKGSGEDQFSSPTAIALDPTTGELDVTDTGNNRVEVFLPDGTYVAKFGAAGGDNEGFESPRGVAVTAGGELDIADYLNNRIAVWQPIQKSEPAWEITSTPNQSEALTGSLEGVSCITSVACTAVGFYATTSVARPLAEGWNGSQWKIQSTPSPTGATSSYLYGVSCASSTVCMGAGYYQNSAGVYLSLAERWNGMQWKIQSTSEPTGTLSSLLLGMSCASSTACMGVGWYENSPGVELPWSARWNGTEWSVQSAPAPSGVKATYPYAVSCTSSTACTMVGYYQNSSGAALPLAEGWNGSQWKVQPAPSPTGGTLTELVGVSCTSTTACAAVGHYRNSSGTEVGLAESWNGSQWKIQSTPTPTGAKFSALDAVSCTSSIACTAAGHYFNLNNSGRLATLAESWNGTEWQIQATANNEQAGSAFYGVGCFSRRWCAAVGSTGQTFAEVYG